MCKHENIGTKKFAFALWSFFWSVFSCIQSEYRKIRTIKSSVFGHFSYSKFDNLKLIIQGKIDILVITETKTDSTFPLNQFAIQGYSKPYRFDRNRNGGGVFIYVRENIPSRELKIHNTPEDIESIFYRNESD